MSQIGYDLVLKKAEVQLMCPECCEDPPNIVEEASSGDIACGSCGLVIEGGVVDQRSEWRTFNQDDKDRGSDPNRVGDGGSLLLHGSQLSTLVSFTGDASVQLSKTQASISKNKGNEKLTNMYHSIEAFSSAGRLSVNVIECAKGVAKAAIDNAWFSSFPNEAALAFIFEGTKRAGEPRSLKDMESLAGTKCMKGIKKYVALLQKGLTASGDSITTGASKATSAKDFMPRFAQQIKMPVWVETIAVQIATAILDVGTLGSRSPRNVAASCLYLASHLVSMPKAIAEICPLAQQQKATIQKSVRLINEDKNSILANKFWPKDPRIKVENWDQINNATYFSKTPSPQSKGSKKNASTASQVQPSPVGRAQGPILQALPVIQQAISSTSYTGGHTKNTKPGSFTTGTPLSQARTATHTTGPINSQPNPVKCKRKAEDEPEEAKPIIKKGKIAPHPYNIESLKKKQYFVWNGLYLPGPMPPSMKKESVMSSGKNTTKQPVPRTVTLTK